MADEARGKIFINYRRSDDPGYTQALFSRLEPAFELENVFMDVENMPAGENFVEVLASQVANCDVFLAVIGKGWLNAKDPESRRSLDNEHDFVRIEIEAALKLQKYIIPVLIGDTPIPRADDLPKSLQPLVVRHAVRLTHDRFPADCQGLIKSIKQAFAKIEAKRLEEQKAAEVEAARWKAEEQARQQAAAEVERERQRRAAIADVLSPEEIAKAEELANWKFIEDLNNEEEYRDHRAKFVGGSTARYALAKLESLAWAKLEANGNETALRAFLAEFPKSSHAAEVSVKLAALERAAKAKQEAETKRRQETDDWAKAASSYDIGEVEAFIKKWPGGQHAGAARTRIAELKRSDLLFRPSLKPDDGLFSTLGRYDLLRPSLKLDDELFRASPKGGDELSSPSPKSGDTLYRPMRPSTHPEEWFSIFMSLAVTFQAVIFIGYLPQYNPANGFVWAIPAWLAIIYVGVQTAFLLVSASQINRALGVLDSVISLVPVLAGFIILITLAFGLRISNFQMETLVALILAGASEFLITIWLRFILNRRTLGFGSY
jgi:hypothetical protein